MTHWKLTLAYNGQPFHGWQVQPGLLTVQGTLAAALQRITGEAVLPQGAGRTDTGVHALVQVASVSLKTDLPPANLRRALNRVLPASIRVLATERVEATFHARHSARGKRYEYRLFESRRHGFGDGPADERICSPFQAPFVWNCRWPLDPDPMRQAAQLVCGTRDFSAMAASSRDDGETAQPNPVKTIHSADWRREGDLLVFRIHGSGFLHHMVRNLVGTLVDIGRGSLRPGDMGRILDSRDRASAGPTAPASGLYLAEVIYPSDEAAMLDPALLHLPLNEVP